MIQPFGEESSTLLLILYLFLGFSGFFLLILLLSIILITLSEDDQILVTIDSEDEEESSSFEKSELEKDVENCENSHRVVSQSGQTQNNVVMKGKQLVILFWKVFENIIQFSNIELSN